jgi:predicted outer membrane repeat protein
VVARSAVCGRANCEFTDNTTLTDVGTGDGGAIGTDGASESTSDSLGGKIEICGTSIRNSQGYGNGGGAYIWAYPPDQVIIDRTTVEGNAIGKNGKSGNCLGGAMRISNAEIIVKDSSFLSNQSGNSGGAFYLDCAPTCTITNSTFYANKAAGYGGAIFSGTSSGRISINNATVASNTQQTSQPNAFFGSATWVINNSIFFNNGCASTGTGAHVLQQGGSGTCISGAISGDPKLGAPADNGGPTYTMLPGAGSAALGAGANCEATDQRALPRNTAACDLGAVEVQ